MGGVSSKTSILKCLTCYQKKQVKPLPGKQILVIKEVYILFMIFDYLPFPDLIRCS